MNNITLIGMPGVGKSTIGVVLAKVLGYQFLDSDLLIQKQERRRLREIIEEEGYTGFKEIENRVNASIDVNHTVIATGGSVVYCEEAMNHLKSVGTVVYLKLSLDSLSKRLGNCSAEAFCLKKDRLLRICTKNVLRFMRNMQMLYWRKRGKIWKKVFMTFWKY